MKKFIAFVALASILAIGLLAGCSSTGSGSAKLGDDGTASFSGKTLTIKLPSNETTGYTWSYEVSGDILKNTADKYEVDASAGSMTGVGGTQTYEFEGTGAGKATVTLTYARSWEKTESDQTCSVTVEADANGNITNLSAEG